MLCSRTADVLTVSISCCLEVTSNNCVDTSECELVANVGVLENSFGQLLQVFPNPTNELLNISFGNSVKEVFIQVEDITGKMVQRNQYKNTQLITMQLNVPKGIYLIQISDGEGNHANIKVFKE